MAEERQTSSSLDQSMQAVACVSKSRFHPSVNDWDENATGQCDVTGDLSGGRPSTPVFVSREN